MPTTPALNGYFGQVRRNEKMATFCITEKPFAMVTMTNIILLNRNLFFPIFFIKQSCLQSIFQKTVVNK